jgi:hypothetical protein
VVLQSAGIGEDFGPRVMVANDEFELMSAFVSGASSPVEGWSIVSESAPRNEELGLTLQEGRRVLNARAIMCVRILLGPGCPSPYRARER